jgi:signal transduction histidine kinase
MAQADDGVLSAFEDQLLNPAVIAHGIREALATLQQPPDAAPAEALHRELAEVDVQLGRLTEAIVLGGNLPTLIERMKALERRRGQVASQLDDLGRVAPVTPGDLHAFEREIQERLGDWRGLLRRNPQQTRQMLTKLLSASLKFTPHVEGEERWYDFAADCTLGNVVGGALHLTQWWPQRDSRVCVHRDLAHGAGRLIG